MENNTDKRIPTHVSIIMDGNGRWAKQRGRERLFGHFEGAESVRVVTRAAHNAGVKYLSLFAFSEENWSRPDDEVNGLMKLMKDTILNEFEAFFENDLRFLVLGNRSRLPDELNEAIDDLMRRTADHKKMTLIVFISYSGQWDILQAAKRLAAEHPDDADSVTPEQFASYLVTAGIPDPDLLIRTSGEYRISNYMLWQSAYTEFYYTPVLWPDFRREEFFAALEEYARRDRRYGKVK